MDCGNQPYLAIDLPDIYTRFESEFEVKAQWEAVKNLPSQLKVTAANERLISYDVPRLQCYAALAGFPPVARWDRRAQHLAHRHTRSSKPFHVDHTGLTLQPAAEELSFAL